MQIRVEPEYGSRHLLRGCGDRQVRHSESLRPQRSSCDSFHRIDIGRPRCGELFPKAGWSRYRLGFATTR